MFTELASMVEAKLSNTSWFGCTVKLGIHLSVFMSKSYLSISGFPRWLSGKESACQCRVQSLCRADLLKEEMATCSSILARKIPWTEEPGGLQSMGLQRVGHNWAHTHTLTYVYSWPLNNRVLEASVPACCIQPTKKSTYKWTCAVQTHVVFVV